MEYRKRVVVKHYEPPHDQKKHDFAKDSEYETIATNDGVGLSMGSIPLSDDEAKEAESLPHVAYVFEDAEVRIPDDREEDFSAASIDALSFHNVNTVHSEGRRGKGAKVCVIDTGIDETHAKNSGFDIVAARSFVGGSAWDYQSHGTNVIGIVLKIAPEATIYSAKGLGNDGSGTLTSIINSCEWGVRQGCTILNLSLSARIAPKNPLNDAIEALVKKGVLVVCAAGNDGCGSKTADNNAPANSPNTISVAAVDLGGRVANFSSCGSTVNIAASGVNVESWGLNGGLSKMSGTSQAAPHLAGHFALFHDHDSEELKTATFAAAKDTNLPVHVEGNGILDSGATMKKLGGDTPKEDAYRPSLPRVSYYRLEKNWDKECVVTTGRWAKIERGRFVPKEKDE